MKTNELESNLLENFDTLIPETFNEDEMLEVRGGGSKDEDVNINLGTGCGCK